MRESGGQGGDRSLVLGSVKIAATYCAVACLWIVLSDEILRHVTSNFEIFTQISMFKGWFFVFATAGMLFHLVRRFAKSLDQERSELRSSLRRNNDIRNRQSLILNSIPGAVYIKDTSHTYTFANQELCRLLGLELEDICGKTDDDFLMAEKAGDIREEEVSVLASGKEVFREGPLDYPNVGSDRVFLTRKIPLYDSDGAITGLCGFATDVTEHVAQARAMAESEARLQLALSATRSAVWEIDAESRVVIRSGKFEEFFGVPSGRGFVQEFWNIVHPDDLPIVSEGLEAAIKTERPINDQFRIIKDGAIRWLRRRARLMKRPGRSSVLIGTVIDVTDMIVLQQQAETNAARRDVLFRNAMDGIVILEDDGSVVECNESFARMLGVSSDAAMRLTVFDWDLQLTRRKYCAKHNAKSNQRWTSRWRRSDGEEIDVEIDSVYTTVDSKPLFMCHCRDVTDKLRAQERIRRLALYDELTGLPNRHAFIQHLQDAIETGEAFSVAQVDIDRFRNLNDSYGHAFGDKVVGEVARRLSALSEEHGFVARLGGDDFAFVARETGASWTVMTARMLAAFERPIEVDGVQLPLSVSLGACSFPDHATDTMGLMRCLDISQHEAKSLGRGRAAHYNPEMGDRERVRHDFELALQLAVEEHQFVLYYQPIMDLRAESVIGCEALVRWEHPDIGMVAPDAFISLAEDTNLIIPLGRWILRTACQQAKAWHDACGMPVKMSVNVSSKQFTSPALVDDVARALADSGLEPRFLQIEITESLLMDDPEEAIKVLGRLKDLGVALAIDDFGTGYSSLGFLNKYPVDCLKVDRSFVADAVHDESSATICRTIVSLAHSLGLSVVAEGVENDDQAAFLLSLGCEMTQGYLYSRPMPTLQFESFLGMSDQQRAA